MSHKAPTYYVSDDEALEAAVTLTYALEQIPDERHRRLALASLETALLLGMHGREASRRRLSKLIQRCWRERRGDVLGLHAEG